MKLKAIMNFQINLNLINTVKPGIFLAFIIYYDAHKLH